MKLQTILLPKENICNVPELYYHRDAEWVTFDGYFNLFYLEKYHTYCDISKLSLELEVNKNVKIQIVHDKEVVSEHVLKVGKNNISLPYEEYDNGVFYFRMQAALGEKIVDSIEDADMKIAAAPGRRSESSKNGDSAADNKKAGIAPVYTSEVVIKGGFKASSSLIRRTSIAVGICTFKREKYVIRNLRSMLGYFEENPQIASLYHVFLVDNGKTLAERDDFKKLLERAERIGDSKLLTYIENRNNGGTGGFTRAMEEAIARKDELSLTNLLLLDDDAVFDPEVFLRLSSFLQLLKDEYKDITVGGAMWREDMPYLMHGLGEYYEDYKVTNPLHMMDLREYENCTKPEVCSPLDYRKLYSGWWCCTYSMKIITKENLPMPLFIHMDDILFCLQHCKEGIALIPGIGVWHQGFELRFPATNEYYNTRNALITEAVMDDIRPWRAARWAIKQLSGPLLSFRYEEMELAYRGIKDFLKGPEWLDEVDEEALHLELLAEYKQRVVMKPLREVLPEAEYEKLREKKLSEKARQQAILDFWTKRTSGGSFKKAISLNGWLLPADKKFGIYSHADSPWKLYKKDTALLYEPEAERGYMEKRRGSKMVRCAFMALRVSVSLLMHYKGMERRYRQRAGER